MKTDYVIGKPGEWPRMIATVKQSDAERDTLDGEVCFPLTKWVPAPHRINAAGTELEPGEHPFEIQKWHRLKDINEAEIDAKASGLDTSKGRVQTCATSLLAITQHSTAALMAQTLGQDWSIEWRMADNSYVVHTAPEMLAMAVEVSKHHSAAKLQHDALRALLDAATDAQAVKAILTDD